MEVEAGDGHVAGYQRRVTDLARRQPWSWAFRANKAVWRGRSACRMIRFKMLVASEILDKPGRLTQAEFEEMKAHPQAGCDMLEDTQIPVAVAETVAQHHERMEGSGYPSGLKGDQTMYSGCGRRRRGPIDRLRLDYLRCLLLIQALSVPQSLVFQERLLRTAHLTCQMPGSVSGPSLGCYNLAIATLRAVMREIETAEEGGVRR